ncbi:MAG TPA: metallophosphoesterase [Candidatus Polarisedimenticolia bacterium]|jgi:Icc-related predicted phosphoesterase|nr:metallophosphoesterase [Candidatus Polarisedimenticolia bacterium]
MKILLFSDIHGDRRALEHIVAQPADLYIAVGDLATFGRGLDRCGPVLQPLGEKLWVLPGNHETHDASRAFCQRFGFVDFHRQVKQLGATHWAGLGYSNITPFHTPGEYSEEEIGKALAAFEGIQPLYLVVHFPPHNTKLDEFSPGKHAGSSTLREWVERVQPARLFCGHIHEAAGLSERLGSTECVNVGKQGYSFEF